MVRGVYRDGQDAAGPAWPPVYSRVRVGSTTVRVAVAGEGPPLLLLNGIGANIEMWQPTARRLPGRQQDLPARSEGAQP